VLLLGTYLGSSRQCRSEADYEHRHRYFGTYREFTDALTEVLAESAGSPARRGRLARARAAVKKNPEYNEHEYFLAVETGFAQWEALQTRIQRFESALHFVSTRAQEAERRLGATAVSLGHASGTSMITWTI
jgi:hypothetical protein